MVRSLWDKMAISFMVATSLYAQDIPSQNKGEQAMISCLRKALDQEDSKLPPNKKIGSSIIIGAGSSGAQAFKDPAPEGKVHVFLTWQWLDAMKGLAKGTIVVMPEHAVNQFFEQIKDKVELITILGVLHDMTKGKLESEKTEAIDEKTEMIVMLAGDVEQPDGTWKCYTPKMVTWFLKKLPQGKKILFLNGPRTGKYKKVKGKMVLNEEAHRTNTDPVTKRVQKECQDHPWKVIDFKYSQPSLWPSALKFCLQNPTLIMVVPGESTSMISEALTLGIKPVIYSHKIMTKTSSLYVDELIKQGKATGFPTLPKETHQQPVEPQERVVIRSLRKLLVQEGK